MNPKPTLLLHIGTAKTGTTSIQEFLACNRSALAEKGILYPSSLGQTNHIKLAAYLEQAPWAFAKAHFGIDSAEKHQAFCLKLKRQLRRELAGQDYHQAIFSNEHLHANIQNQGPIRILKQLLKRHFSDIRVLVYFRRQDLMSVSRYSTALLAGHTPAHPLDVNTTHQYYYRFNAIYENWARVFGPKNITVRSFSREQLVAGNVISDFCTQAGLTETPGLTMTGRKNEAISLEAACLLHELNSRAKTGRLVFSRPQQRKQLIEQITAQYPGQAFCPGRQSAIAFYQACLPYNNALEKRLGIKLFNDDFSMYPEQDDTALYAAKRLWAKAALDGLLDTST